MSALPTGVIALARALSSGAISATEACREYLARIERDNPRINAFVHIMPETALAAAAAADRRRSAARTIGPLDGVPIAIKDNIDVVDAPTAGGIEHFRNNMATHDAFVASELRRAGAVILGKLNMHEGALGATTDNPWFGRCENPLRAGYTPGGSSGGSGAAVAAGLCAAALGSDTLGSVRIPAAYCGTAGLKPTFGRVSTRGVMPLSWTFDHVGFLAPRVGDLLPMLDACGSFDATWPHARRMPRTRTTVPPFGVLRLGRPRQLASAGLEPAVERAYEDALRRLAERGARVVDIGLGDYDWTRVRRESLLLSEIEAASVYATAIAADPNGFSDAYRNMLAFGGRQTGPRAAESYRRLAEARVLLERAMDDIDAIILPTAPQAAFAFDAPVPINQADLAAIANILGAPAACVPFGVSSDGLPLSIQAVTRPFTDDLAVAIAAALEN